MNCKKCNSDKTVILSTEKVGNYKREYTYLCNDCYSLSYKTSLTMGALYTTEKFAE